MTVSRAAKMCTNKRAYTTLAYAHRVGEKRGLRVYQCPRCSFWHLTSKNVRDEIADWHPGTSRQ